MIYQISKLADICISTTHSLSDHGGLFELVARISLFVSDIPSQILEDFYLIPELDTLNIHAEGSTLRAL